MRFSTLETAFDLLRQIATLDEPRRQPLTKFDQEVRNDAKRSLLTLIDPPIPASLRRTPQIALPFGTERARRNPPI